MPFQSREILTVELLLDCFPDDVSNTVLEPPLLRLPAEIRLKVLRELLHMESDVQIHTRRSSGDDIERLLRVDPRRILDAPQFQHKGRQEINGTLPTITKRKIYPAILQTCKRLCREGQGVLYDENNVVGIQTGLRGFDTKMKNHGMNLWGPFESKRIAPKAKTRLRTQFDPIVLYHGQTCKADAPLYLCHYSDATTLVHALWVIIKSHFARDMRFSLHLTSTRGYHRFELAKYHTTNVALPWLSSHIISLDTGPSDKKTAFDVSHLKLELCTHHTLNTRNVSGSLYHYGLLCSVLESDMTKADSWIKLGEYILAEMLYEQICYQACSIIRTRTAKLVEVSSKTTEGINRICRIVALSAYRLCELRSGTLRFPRSLTAGLLDGPQEVKSADAQESQLQCATTYERVLDLNDADQITPTTEIESKNMTIEQIVAVDSDDDNNDPGQVKPLSRTTRLPQELATEQAIVSGLLALRLPCATSVPEWNLRLNVMLLRLFINQEDFENGMTCTRRILANAKVLSHESKHKDKTKPRLGYLLKFLNFLANDGTIVNAKTKKQRLEALEKYLETTADMCTYVIESYWGERLVPKQGYLGLVWTFRWA